MMILVLLVKDRVSFAGAECVRAGGPGGAVTPGEVHEVRRQVVTSK
jgi:hypothetical protein